jgi:hypothetical protein
VFGVNPLRKENLPHKDVAPAAFGGFTLDADAVDGPLPSGDIRPDGLACRIKAFLPGSKAEKPDTELYLTEFADADCRAIYFRLADASRGVNDELLGPDAPRDGF